MYHHPLDVNPTFNTNFTINYWIEKGASPRKLVLGKRKYSFNLFKTLTQFTRFIFYILFKLGMPMYGQSFSLAENKRHGLNSPSKKIYSIFQK